MFLSLSPFFLLVMLNIIIFGLFSICLPVGQCSLSWCDSDVLEATETLVSMNSSLSKDWCPWSVGASSWGKSHVNMLICKFTNSRRTFGFHILHNIIWALCTPFFRETVLTFGWFLLQVEMLSSLFLLDVFSCNKYLFTLSVRRLHC